jgi:5-carboxymethyl-2-hydroxymuconate isomerase
MPHIIAEYSADLEDRLDAPEMTFRCNTLRARARNAA